MKKSRISLIAGLMGLATMTTFNVQADSKPKFPALDAMPKSGPTIQQVGIKPDYSNISFSNESKTQTLDVYLPKHSKNSSPVVIYAHPGGFRFGDKSMGSAAIAKGFLDNGYALVTVNYRLSGEARFPSAVQDFFAAIAYIKNNATNFKIDPNNIYLFGESAGANIVSLAGTAYDNSEFRALIKNDNLNLKPSGVIALYPPVDFSKIDEMLISQGCDKKNANHNSAEGFESIYLGDALTNIPQKVKQTNPITYVSNQSPPFFIQNGNKDCNVGNGQSQLLVDELKKNGVYVEYSMIDGAGHGGSEFETKDNISSMLLFLKNNR